ncbi:unnamed protein product [Trichogramma brassicae]|uniref:CCHC-type domain-containing protein n=1 Tax=Trichogramma brassicae TaxID=86971 RepID=A0A6H5IA14_9HYME|nr:unnamed protein product [Trichogramma brassicae]
MAPRRKHQKKKKSTGTPTPKLHGKARRKQRLRKLVEQRKKARRDAAKQRERTRSDAAEQREKALSDAAKQHEKAPSDATEQLTEVMVRDRLHQRALARKTDTPMEVTCAACENETVSVQSIDDAELVLVSADSEVVTLPSTDEKLLNDVQVDAVPVQTTVPPEGPAEAEKLDAVVSLLPWRLIPITPSYRPTSRAVLQRRAEFHENREIIVRQQLRELEAEKRKRLKPEPMVRDIFAERLDVPDEEYNEWLHPTCKARASHGMSTAVSDGLQSPQGQTSVEKPGGPSLMEPDGPLPTPRTSPYTMVKAITGKIIVAPLHCKEKDAKLPSPAEFATGTLEDKLERLDGLIRGLGQFIQGKSNLHKEVISYQVSLGMALSALRKSLESQVPPRPSAADKAVCTSPLFTGSATSKRLATSPLASHDTPKRHAVTPASKQHDENNNEVEDQDGLVLVNRRRHRQRKKTAATPGAVHARQQPKPRPVQRRARHRPNVIVIKAKDASKYADILRSLKSDPTLQQKVDSSVNNIRRSAAGALMLQLMKGVENASDLGEELGKVLGTAATASALLHTSTIEIKDLDECATKEEVTAALDALLGVPVSKRDPVRSLRKAYAGTQVAVVALPDDLVATALKLGHVRIGWVNCRIRAREEAARCYRCWSPGHVAAGCKGPDRTELCYRCGQKGHQAKDCKGQPSYLGGAWRNSGVQERPARVHPYFAWARIGGIFFFSVYAPPRLSEREFSALLANITEEARGRGPLVIAGDFNAWSTEWGCRETRPRASILLDSLALLDAVLLNTGDVPTFNGRQGSSIVDLTFVCETLTPRVLSWTVSGLYTHSDHQAIVFEIEDNGASSGPSTRRSYRWNARSLDVDRFSAVVSGASVAPGTAEDMASGLMSVITCACDASMSKANPRRRRREPRARRLFQRSRGRHDEETHSANYASARRLLRVAIKTSKRRCWRQLCDEVDNDVWGKPYKVAMSRLGCPQAKQPSSPLLVRGAVAALFSRVPSGPAL